MHGTPQHTSPLNPYTLQSPHTLTSFLTFPHTPTHFPTPTPHLSSPLPTFFFTFPHISQLPNTLPHSLHTLSHTSIHPKHLSPHLSLPPPHTSTLTPNTPTPLLPHLRFMKMWQSYLAACDQSFLYQRVVRLFLIFVSLL